MLPSDSICGDALIRRPDAWNPRGTLGRPAPLKHEPTPAITSAFDLGRWFHALDAEDQELLRRRARGDTFEELGCAMGRSTSRVFARREKLGEQLAENAGVGKVESSPSASRMPRRATS